MKIHLFGKWYLYKKEAANEAKERRRNTKGHCSCCGVKRPFYSRFKTCKRCRATQKRYYNKKKNEKLLRRDK